MPDEAEQALAKLTEGWTNVSMRKMIVDAVRTDGRVNLRDGETIVPSVPCLPGYVNRAAEDQVVVLRGRMGIVVIGRLGAEQIPTSPDPVDISWGAGPPSGVGWVTGTPYVRDGELYLDTGGGGGGGTSTPRPTTIGPTARAAWRNGHRENDRPVTQGAWPSYPQPFKGGWFYGSAITAACAGKSVASMRIRLGRTSASHGSFGQVKPRLYLTSTGTPGSAPPAISDGPRPGPGLGLGGVASWTLPGSWVSALASGAARGIVVSAGVGSDYLIFDGASGGVTITFD